MSFETYFEKGIQARDRDLAKVEKQLASIYADAYRETANELSGFMAQGFDAEQARKYGRLAKLLKGIQKEYKRITGKALDTTATASADAYIEAYKWYEFSLGQSAELALNFGMPPIEAVRAAVFNLESGLDITEIYGKNAVAEYSRIQATITRGIIQGKGYATVAKELRNDFLGGYYNARRVVWTENTRVWTEGTLAANEAAKELGIDLPKVWIATLDSRTRDAHGRLDGETADKDGYFKVDGAKAQGPGLFGVPELDINCRCSVSYRDTTVPPSVRRVKGEGFVPYQTYAQWAGAQGWTPENGWPKVKKV